ncbi:MAG: hypothetical protein H6Q54_1500 [Deltaproteobacteria bacterium]|jgi:hypothetical protein|nr:hypothetical protein [Deltaproteobacteria bacterium]
MTTRKSVIAKVTWLAALVCFLILVQPSFADEREKLLGVWKLVSWEREIIETGKRNPHPNLGKNATGYLIFTSEGRMMALITGEGRLGLTGDALNVSMYAYSGKYELKDDKWITKVDAAWNPGWVGTNQMRSFKFDADRLVVITGTGRGERDIITWEKEKD